MGRFNVLGLLVSTVITLNTWTLLKNFFRRQNSFNSVSLDCPGFSVKIFQSRLEQNLRWPKWLLPILPCLPYVFGLPEQTV